MKFIAIGAHLMRDDVEPVAEAIPVGDLFVSAICVPDDQPVGDRDLLLKVAHVRAKLLEVATFIAIRYGFSFATAAEAQAKCQAHLERWKRMLTEHRGHVEMSLKVAASSTTPRPDRREFASGADYLRALHAATQAANVDPAFRALADQRIVPLSEKHRWHHRDEKSIELTLLIAREQIGAVNAVGVELRATGVPFLLSGPWPLEVFADDHE